MTRKFALLVVALAVSCLLFMVARANERSHKINLPTSKTLTLPVSGFVARTNSYPATIALSPDGRYAALLNQGYGTEQSGVRQSIAILDLSNNQLRDFPDERLRGDEKVNAAELLYWASLFNRWQTSLCVDVIDHAERHRGIHFADGQVTPERFITIPAQRLAPGEKSHLRHWRNS